MSPAECEHAGEVIRRRKIGIAGLTEVRSRVMRKAIRRGLGGSYGWKNGGESPQAFNSKRWKIVETKVELGTDGVTGITPNLAIVTVVYQDRRNVRKRIAVVSTHLVPLTLHGRPRPDMELRRPMWDAHWGKLTRIVRTLHERGLTVFVIGDFNDLAAGAGKIREVHPQARWLVRSSLDWIFVVEGSVRVRKLGPAFSFSTGSDHKGRGVNVLLSVKR
jgi:hypothetical protein